MLRRIVLSLVAAGAVVLFVVGFQLSKEPNPKAVLTDRAVVAIYPDNGDLDLRQSTIGFKLDPLYDGELIVDGFHVPANEVRHVLGTNQYLYQPGPDKVTGSLRPGRHLVEARFWNKNDPANVRSIRWQFNAH